MDALFIIVAELLLLPLILWALIVIELVLGTLGTLVGIVLGRRSPGDLIRRQWLRLRRRLVWSLLLLALGLVLVDLVFFEPLVNVVLGSIDDRDDLEVRFAHAEGSFILGRIEIDKLELAGVRGELDDPNARFELSIDALVIDIDTAALLVADFAIEELSLDGVHGSFDRFRRGPPKREPEQPGPAREFRVDRLHVGALDLVVRDHVGVDPALAKPRELALELAELDIGPLRSDNAAFDMLYRSRGRGSIRGVAFEFANHDVEGAPQMTLEIHDMPLAELAAPLERAAGVRASGSADLVVVDRYLADAEPPAVEIAVTLSLREFELRAGDKATLGTKVMLELAGRALEQLGRDFPVRFSLQISEADLAGSRGLAESGVAERFADAAAKALRDELQRAAQSKP